MRFIGFFKEQAWVCVGLVLLNGHPAVGAGFNDVPEELLPEIFQHLPVRELERLKRVSKGVKQGVRATYDLRADLRAAACVAEIKSLDSMEILKRGFGSQFYISDGKIIEFPRANVPLSFLWIQHQGDSSQLVVNLGEISREIRGKLPCLKLSDEEKRVAEQIAARALVIADRLGIK